MPHTIEPVDKQQTQHTEHGHRKLHSNSTTTSATAMTHEPPIFQDDESSTGGPSSQLT